MTWSATDWGLQNDGTHSVHPPSDRTKDHVRAIGVSSDGQRVALGCDSGNVSLRSAAGKLLAELPRQSGGVSALAFARGDRYVVTAGEDWLVKVWDAASGRHVRTLYGHRGPVDYVSVEPSGEWVATGSWDGSVRVWELESGRCAAILRLRAADTRP